jgi:ABC-type transporter Mla subunit MlaD
MIQKLALVILTVMVIGLIFNQPCNANKHSKRRYHLFIKIDSSDNVKSDASVLLNGKQIGIVNEINQAGNKKVVDMSVYADVKIPSGAFVTYFENLTGDSYISFTQPEKSMVLTTINPHDTISMGPLRNGASLDSTSARVLVNIIHDVIKVVDSNLKKEKGRTHE